jgi:hypothetical protein
VRQQRVTAASAALILGTTATTAAPDTGATATVVTTSATAAAIAATTATTGVTDDAATDVATATSATAAAVAGSHAKHAGPRGGYTRDAEKQLAQKNSQKHTRGQKSTANRTPSTRHT